jgi:proteasome lid subunit RPN8/RPN11
MRFRITRDVYDEIARTVGSLHAEHGGALGRREEDDVVRYFRFDETALNTGATYSPDHEALNEMFKSDWNPKGIRLAGFVHSHPSRFARPSAGDLEYARRILAAIPDMPNIFLPIVLTKPDTGKFTIVPFIVTRNGDSVQDHPVDLEILDLAAPAPAGPAGTKAGLRGWRKSHTEAVRPDETFDRVTDAYDLKRMARARVVAVGTGGAASFIEDLARCAVGEFVLIDSDVISESNLATQQVYRKDIGQSKVAVLAGRLRDINPAVRVRTVAKNLGDLDDEAMRKLCCEPIGGQRPEVSLLCGLTDNFFAQARINALALHLGLPSLCAQVWPQGRGAEVTFTYPGVTPACHRCILATRYAAFLSDGYENDVTSHGTPIFATSRLNAIKGFLALALLHHHEDGALAVSATRFAGLTARIGDRNLLQIRMDPDLTEVLRIRTFDRVFTGSDTQSLFFDETVWRAQAPLSGADGAERCPDCGGTGDLREAIGTFDDTRRIRTTER